MREVEKIFKAYQYFFIKSENETWKTIATKPVYR